MPVAKSLHKVSKKVAGSEKSVHPRGRKFKQLNKATLRQAKLAKHKAVRTNAKEAEFVRYKYFREAVKLAGVESFSLEEIRNLIEVYVERDRDELEKLKSERRPGRPASSRQDTLQRRMDLERNEFKTGYNLPDLTDKENVERLLKWDGGIGGIIQVNMIRVTEKPTETTSKTDTEMQE